MARQPKRSKEEMLQRTVKWPLSLSSEQEELIIKVSDGLRYWYAWALETEKASFEAYQTALKADPETKPNGKKFLSEIDLYSLFRPLRERDANDDLFRAKVPANWVLETFKAAVAGYKSFFALVKNGDPDARTPKPRDAGYFQAIPGCSAFSKKGDRIVLAPEIFGANTFAFPIPPSYQADMLARSIRLAKFIISRDESNLAKPGRFFISVSYEIALPQQTPFVPEEAVYIALGASSIAVISSKGEEVIDLWRADTHWKPRADAIQASLARPAGAPACARPLKKGSRKSRRLEAKRRKMFRIMGAQQKQNRREVVAIDLLEKTVNGITRGHGTHFVVTDMVVRSKEGKLADSSKEGRGGSLGLNWAAQNTGTIAYLVDWLSEKAREYGGSVRKHSLLRSTLPERLPYNENERRILVARALRDDFLRSREVGEAA